MAKRLIKSAEELDEQNDENQFELDESIVDEVSNAEEFADVEITNEDIMDAVEAIDALADAVIEKADAEEKEIDADELLDQVRDMIDDSHEEEPEEEEVEEAEIPEEIESSVVRVMVSEDGAIDLEQKPDEIYDQDVDGLECTVFDTVDDYPMELDETAPTEEVEDDTLIIGNSASKKFKKGYITIKSSTNKKAWSTAYKKVKKMVGSSKLTAAHWVIVSALAKKEEEKDKLKKKIECRLIRAIRSNKEVKTKFFKAIKSDFDVAGQDTQDDIQKEGQTEQEAKPDMIAEPKNNGVEEVSNDGVPSEAGDPEGVTEEFGNPTEDPDRQDEREDEIVLPEESITIVEVPLANSVRKVRLQKVRSSKMRNYNLYKVVSNKDMSVLDGKVVKSGKLAYAFKNTTQGMIACCAKYVANGKGTYKPVLKNNKVVITRGGATAPVFQNYEKIQIAKAIVSARKEGFEAGKREAIKSARCPSIQSRKDELLARRNAMIKSSPEKLGFFNENTIVYDNGQVSVNRGNGWTYGGTVKELDQYTGYEGLLDWYNEQKGKSIKNSRRNEVIKSRLETRKAQAREQKAIQSRAELVKMHEAEERQRLFQSSQTQMDEEKVALKSASNRNTAALDKLYNSMF